MKKIRELILENSEKKVYFGNNNEVVVYFDGCHYVMEHKCDAILELFENTIFSKNLNKTRKGFESLLRKYGWL